MNAPAISKVDSARSGRGTAASAHPSHRARITGPIGYVNGVGLPAQIPLGPCLVEQVDARLVDIVWGAQGQSSTALPVEEIASATESGHLVLLD